MSQRAKARMPAEPENRIPHALAADSTGRETVRWWCTECGLPDAPRGGRYELDAPCPPLRIHMALVRPQHRCRRNRRRAARGWPVRRLLHLAALPGRPGALRLVLVAHMRPRMQPPASSGRGLARQRLTVRTCRGGQRSSAALSTPHKTSTSPYADRSECADATSGGNGPACALPASLNWCVSRSPVTSGRVA